MQEGERAKSDIREGARRGFPRGRVVASKERERATRSVEIPASEPRRRMEWLQRCRSERGSATSRDGSPSISDSDLSSITDSSRSSPCEEEQSSWLPNLLAALPKVLQTSASNAAGDMTAVVETIVSATSIVASSAVFEDESGGKGSLPLDSSRGVLKLAPACHDIEVPAVAPEQAIIVVSNILKSLCERHDGDVTVPQPDVDLSCFYSVQKQDFDIEFYVRRVFKYVDTTPNAFVNTLVYLNRLEYANDLLKINSFNVHRVFLTAVVLATKFLDDQVYSNKHYATVGGVSSTHEMNQLELTMLKQLNFRVHVDLETHTKYQQLFFE
eukprot:CAMPEP_0198335024 /NCGR_PEP_ID=MMETSP1450-20131203/20021_1 /TAXON_ID=753684 ORGANISM="Madagascaria erythrocladiodes, Strain CCMP3234" /NCGR_SAMPLE_ID=MMETSP1450 /ASSEMBLY_ACC=CAM_ASM_001115 /LENGTH=326 /DNA_ID=CAMNT_0044039653 /DNA_START=125 /DNA_END=1105 /DNA_ORIENTATION=-